ncbi:glycosyltransferase family 1 protein [Paucibacter aquatile]|uniref:Glycosyltransferase family 1 protein n=1 Tax=Kinneretia aquatilis TaxID=2070761 RepID=A0A2N8KWG6_9BURK|nr:glycosyltransferase family 4 protein [Paucibacter aquatile]PND37781.1 glycosyltransferase family 1 protein [Paucibacter aquatile]
MKIVICINTAWNILNFRRGLIEALLQDGHQVIALAPRDSFANELVALGCQFVDMPMPNGGTNPIEDLRLLSRMKGYFRAERPDILLSYTAKPNIYGSIAAKATGIPVINNVAGLGAAFISKSLLTVVVKILYRHALRTSDRVFFQNATDRDLFVTERLVDVKQTGLLPGSGINLKRFQPETRKRANEPFRFLLIGRMLRDKGVVEFVEAARELGRRHHNVDFALLGAADYDNPAAISRQQVDEWVRDGLVTYLGTRKDVRAEIAAADCVVLPSYREGTPRTLLEAAAMAKPIVATDAVGCREVVAHGENGLLCRVADAADLAAKLEQMLLLSDEARAAMGAAGRLKMQREFDETLVIQHYRKAIAEIARESHPNK